MGGQTGLEERMALVDTVSFTCTVKPFTKGEKGGCGYQVTKKMTKAEVTGLFGEHPKNPAGTCPKCGKRMSFSIASVTRAVNQMLFG